MKRRFEIILLIIFIFVLIIFINRKLKKEHQVKYSINKFNITETFYIGGNSHNYDFVIRNKKQSYSFSINNNLNKRKKVLKDIKSYKEGNLSCIVPTYKNKKVKRNIYCLDNNIQTSNYLLKDSKEFNKILKSTKYKITIPRTSNKTKNYKNLTIYKNNIDSDEYFLIWNYKGLYVLKENNFVYKKILDKDLYDNIMSIVVDKYYYLFDNRSVNGIKDVYYYDLVKNKLKKISLNEAIDKSSYINGIYKNNIYITDIKNKKEYKLNINNNRLEQVNNDDMGYLVYRNRKREELSKADFYDEKKYFSNYEITNKNISKKKIREEGSYYYYYEYNNFYRQLKSGNKELLFYVDSIDDWKVLRNTIIFVKNGILYKYTEYNGLEKILKSNELKYNYLNIYDYWKDM